MRSLSYIAIFFFILVCLDWGAADPNADAEASPDAEAVADATPDADADADAQYYGGPPQSEPGCGLMGSCCSMSEEGCCVGGQQCYTYYENVCENTNKAKCNIRGKKFCENINLQDCRIVRERGTVVMFDEVCRPAPKRECFNYDKTVCVMTPLKEEKAIQWENQRLKKIEDLVKLKCEMVKRCNYTTETRVEVRTVPRQKCEEIVSTRKVCTNVPKTEYRVEPRVTYVVQYKQDCQYVNQPICSTSSCAPTGCLNGESVCSNSDYNTTLVCPQGQAAGCQEVQMPVCYGNIGSCNYLSQQCCTSNTQRMCQQIPQRVPIQRNVTVPVTQVVTDCKDVEIKTPNCRTEYYTKNVTKSFDKCNQVIQEDCHNITIPQYTVVTESKNETTKFSVIKCERKKEQGSFCTSVPAEVECKNKPVRKNFIINRVVCDRNRNVQFCRTIPESECVNVPGQNCRIVPRQVCQPTCSDSPMCNQCEDFRVRGGFSTCDSGMCTNFYPPDGYYNASFGGGGYNPGDYTGAGGYNPGFDIGGGGYNPGNYNGGSGYNPGNYNGGSGYNPGNSNGGGGYNPGNFNGGSGFNPGNYNGGSGYNPGDGSDGNYYGGGGYNPGYVSEGGIYNPEDVSGNVYNPGNVIGGGGWNPGWFGEDVYNPRLEIDQYSSTGLSEGVRSTSLLQEDVERAEAVEE